MQEQRATLPLVPPRGAAVAAVLFLACLGSSGPAGPRGVCAQEDALASVDDQLREVLAQYADAKKQIAITFTNNGYMDFAMNWLHYVEEAGVENYLIFALDSEANEALKKRDAHVFYDPALDQGKIERRATDFGSDPFKKIVHLKPTLTLRVLELGFYLLLSDADVVWFQVCQSCKRLARSTLDFWSAAASLVCSDFPCLLGPEPVHAA